MPVDMSPVVVVVVLVPADAVLGPVPLSVAEPLPPLLPSLSLAAPASPSSEQPVSSDPAANQTNAILFNELVILPTPVTTTAS
jgi:hypothetical protein